MSIFKSVVRLVAVTAIFAVGLRGQMQDVRIPAVAATDGVTTANLAFGKDGSMLREMETTGPASEVQSWRVRAVSYDAATGQSEHVFNLQPRTQFFSATTDAVTVVIGADIDTPGKSAHFFLFDADTGKTQDIPSDWIGGENYPPFIAISGDGLLVSAYAESDTGMVVTVYDWSTKKVVAKQTSNYFAGGFLWGCPHRPVSPERRFPRCASRVSCRGTPTAQPRASGRRTDSISYHAVTRRAFSLGGSS
jgi:hypothetical protein